MKRSILLLGMVALLCSCDKKKNYCVCRLYTNPKLEISKREMTKDNTKSCAQTEIETQMIYPNSYCQIEEE